MNKLKLYTAWGKCGYANTLIEGSGPPRFANGAIDLDCPELIFTIEAPSWTEANKIYHKLQGWEPYIELEEYD